MNTDLRPHLWQLPLSPSLHPSSRVLFQRTSLSSATLVPAGSALSPGTQLT